MPGEIHCTLVIGKLRVAPVKVTTISRLELTSAVVAMRIFFFLKKGLELKDIPEHHWIDTKMVLVYINNETRQLHVFVVN